MKNKGMAVNYWQELLNVKSRLFQVILSLLTFPAV